MSSILEILGLKKPLCEYSEKCTEYKEGSFACNEESYRKTYCEEYDKFENEKHEKKKQPPKGALPLGF